MSNSNQNNGNKPNTSNEVPSGTIVPALDGIATPSSTTYPPLGTPPPVSGTIAQPGTGYNENVPFPEYGFYDIKAVKYQVLSTLSSDSGEANIYCVEANNKKYALKVYKFNRHPDHTVLDIIKSISERFGDKSLLVRIFDHGIWKDPQTGYDFDYELMEYCSGGSLASLVLGKTKDEEQFKKIAMQMASAIDFCHRYANLLHRDIKPANFLFSDDTRQRLVLTDFGIAKIMNDNHEVPNVDIGRTIVYVAPEIYNRMSGVDFSIGPSSDYYALGMSLLALWIGEGILTADEKSLFNKKQDESLPYPSSTEMSEHSLSLIKKLTRLVPSRRATFEDIKEWRQGKIIFTENNFYMNNDFKPITFHREKNIIATSPQHLARIMWENQELAKRYLYHDKVKEWFDGMNWNEISVSIHEITEELYPHDQNAGLYATCLLLDENLPLLMDMNAQYDGGSHPLKTPSDIAKELFNNDYKYIQEGKIKSPDHLLWVYLNQRPPAISNKDINRYQSLIAKYGVRQLRQLCYFLDNSLPFRFNINGKDKEFDELKDVFEALNSGEIAPNDICSLDNLDFGTWVRMSDPIRYDSFLDSLNDKADTWTNEDNAWNFIYSIGWDQGYDFLPALADDDQMKSRIVTIEDIALKIADEINSGNIKQGTLSSQVSGQNFVHTRLYHYLHLRKKYNDLITYWIYCTDFQDPEINKRYGPYNKTIGLMKAVSGTIGYFPLKVGNLILKSLNDYQNDEKAVNELIQRDAALRELFTDWLSLQFQENPKADISNRNYYKLTENYLNYLESHVPDSKPALSSKAIGDKIADGKQEYSAAKNKVKGIKLLTTLFCFVPLTIISIAAIAGLLFVDSIIFKEVMVKVGEILGGICAIVVFFSILSDDFNIIGGLIIGAIVYFVVKWICSIATPIVPWLLVGLLVIIMIYFGKSIFKGNGFFLYDQWGDGNTPLDEAEKRAHLAAAFDSKSKLLPNVPDNYPACVYSNSATEVKKTIKPLLIKSLIMLVLTAIVIVGLSWGFYKVSETESHSITQTASKMEEKSHVITDLTGHYTGTFHERKAELVLEMSPQNGKFQLKGTVTIYYSTTMKQNVVGVLDGDLVILNVTKNGKVNNRITYNANYWKDGANKIRISGHYSNLVQNSFHDFDFTKDN